MVNSDRVRRWLGATMCRAAGLGRFTAPLATSRRWFCLPYTLVESGGLEPCRCSRPARDAAPTITPTIFCSDRLAADAGPGRRAHRRDLLRLVSGADLDVLALVNAAPDFHKSGPMPSMRPTSWGSARNRRARTGREAVEVVGVVSLGTLPAGTTEAQVDD